MQVLINSDDLDEDIIELELNCLTGYVEASLAAGCDIDEMIVVLQMTLEAMVEMRGADTLH